MNWAEMVLRPFDKFRSCINVGIKTKKDFQVIGDGPTDGWMDGPTDRWTTKWPLELRSTRLQIS